MKDHYQNNETIPNCWPQKT